jgi:hypothetical protein
MCSLELWPLNHRGGRRVHSFRKLCLTSSFRERASSTQQIHLSHSKRISTLLTLCKWTTKWHAHESVRALSATQGIISRISLGRSDTILCLICSKCVQNICCSSVWVGNGCLREGYNPEDTPVLRPPLRLEASRTECRPKCQDWTS